MTDGKSVEVQSHELQKIAHEIVSEGMNLDEQFQVAVIIDKPPSNWKEFKNSLRYKTKEFSLKSLIALLRIEEEARRQDQREKVLTVSKPAAVVLKPNIKIKQQQPQLEPQQQPELQQPQPEPQRP